MENIENIVKIDVQGFQDLCSKLGELEEENKELKQTISRQRRMINGLKINNRKITLERNELCDKLHEIQNLSMFEFGNRYGSDESLEEDGRRFARELLGHRMTDEEVAIEAAENSHVPYTGDDF